MMRRRHVRGAFGVFPERSLVKMRFPNESERQLGHAKSLAFCGNSGSKLMPVS